MEAFIISIIQNYLYAGVFLLLLACGLGVPMPEDVILVTGGYISHLYPGNVNLFVLIPIALAGVLMGDTIIFMAGRHFGPRVMNIPMFRRILTPRREAKMLGYFRSYGDKIVFVARFMAGIRAPLFMTAGISGLKYRRFILLDGIAACISVPTFILLANYFGDDIDRLKHMLVRTQKALFVIIPVAIVVWLLFKKFAWKREANIPPDEQKDDSGERKDGSDVPAVPPEPSADAPPPVPENEPDRKWTEQSHPNRRKTDVPRPAARPEGQVEEEGASPPPDDKPRKRPDEDL